MIDLDSQFKAIETAEKGRLTAWLAARPWRTLLVGMGVGVVLMVAIRIWLG